MANPEAIKSRLAQKGIGGVAVQEPPATQPVPSQARSGGSQPFNKPKPAVVGTEPVKATCGHEVPFELFEANKDKFRNERRKKVTDRACAACREHKRQEEEAAAKVRQGQKQHQAKDATAGAPGSRKPLGWITERLPDGAKFEVVYSAAETRWTGTLSIGERTFTDSASAVFKLLRRLDQQYRQPLPQA